jgi:Rrf2 family transcriptional regulator, iron-sulfur cluster assembly transcription factor
MRLDVTRKSDLALRALVELGVTRCNTKSASLAASLGTTAGFIPQILAPLMAKGWVHSEPGPTGGYRLQADLTGLSILEVVEAIEGPTDSGRCVMGAALCGDKGCCALHRAWATARAALAAELAATSVAMLAAESLASS